MILVPFPRFVFRRGNPFCRAGERAVDKARFQIQLAALQHAEAEFESLRQELTHETMPGRLRAHFRLVAGEGLRAFGDATGARVEFAEAVTLAETHRVYTLLVEAEALLRLTPEIRPMARQSTPRHLGVAAILQAIDQRRGAFAEATT